MRAKSVHLTKGRKTYQYIHTHTHTHTHVYEHVHTRTNTHTRKNNHIEPNTHTHTDHEQGKKTRETNTHTQNEPAKMERRGEQPTGSDLEPVHPPDLYILTTASAWDRTPGTSPLRLHHNQDYRTLRKGNTTFTNLGSINQTHEQSGIYTPRTTPSKNTGTPPRKTHQRDTGMQTNCTE